MIEWGAVVMAAAVGYLFGSISFARVVVAAWPPDAPVGGALRGVAPDAWLARAEDPIAGWVFALGVAAARFADGGAIVAVVERVIEREFSYPLINRVTGLSEKELLSHLSALKDSELLYERGIYPQSNYIFKHALTREVVYDSILAKRKKKLHEEIGNAIEQLYKDNLSEHFEVLAEHYFLSENYPKSVEYSKLASRKAEKTASLNDAIDYTKKSTISLERLAQTEDVQKQIIDASVVLGLYLAQMIFNAEAKEAIDPIVDLVAWVKGEVGIEERARQYGHRAAFVLVTGGRHTGKSFLAKKLEARLVADGRHAYLLDGENLLRGLDADLSESERSQTAEMARRYGEVARLLADTGLIVVSTTNPFGPAYIEPSKRSGRSCIRPR